MLSLCLISAFSMQAMTLALGASYADDPADDYSLVGDVNLDGMVDVADIATIISCLADDVENAYADVNGDGTVDVADISALIDLMAGRKVDRTSWPGIKLQLNGASCFFLMEDEPVSKISNDVLTITTKTEEVRFPLNGNAAMFTFVDLISHIVEIAEIRQPFFRFSDLAVEAIGLQPETTFSLYDQDGRLTAETIVGKDSYAKLPVKSPGYYTVKSADAAFTIKKR